LAATYLNAFNLKCYSLLHANGIAQTDDVGIFCSPLSQEYYLAAKHFGLDKKDIRKLCVGAVEVIFGGEAEKSRLREIYEGWPGWDGDDPFSYA
jgi:hypothetical protein